MKPIFIINIQITKHNTFGYFGYHTIIDIM